MKLRYRWRNRRLPHPPRSELSVFAAAAARAAGLDELREWYLEIDFVGDRSMTRLNREIVGHLGTTDVITVSYFDDPESFFPGDTGVELFVNADIAAREGTKRGTGYSYEMALYVVHGLLHSAGEDDLAPEPRRRMRRREREVLAAVRAAGIDFTRVFPSARKPTHR